MVFLSPLSSSHHQGWRFKQRGFDLVKRRGECLKFMHQKFLLSNGLRVILAPHEDTKAITLLALFRIGSRYEKQKTLGISHFLEHMMFKGTKKRPETTLIARELDGVGAEYNAFTGKDHTGYYIKLNYEKTDLALDIMHDMLANSLVKHEEVERERRVILEEIHMYEDNPIMLVEELFEEELFRGSSLGWRIAGNEQTLARIDRQELIDFRQAHYRPVETVLVAAGRLPEKIRIAIERTFGQLKSGLARRARFQSFRSRPGHRQGPRLKFRFKQTDQVQVALGFPALALADQRLPALNVLSTILGGTMSSRLFIAVRERRGLAYSVHSSINAYEDMGNLVVQAGLDKSRADEALKVIATELGRLSRSGVTNSELARGKENIRGRLTLAMEDSQAVAEFFGKQELHLDKIKTPDEKLAEIFAVRSEEVRAVARQVLNSQKMAAAMIGPFEDSRRFIKLMKFK